MAIFVLDGVRCPALFLSGIEPNGDPKAAVYFYRSHEAPDSAPEIKSTNSLIRVPDDDGASWTAANHPKGAHFYVIVPDDTPLQTVTNRLVAAYSNRKRAAEEAHENFFGPPLLEQPVDASGEPAGPVVSAQPVAPPSQAPQRVFHPADRSQDGKISQRDADLWFAKEGIHLKVGPYNTNTGEVEEV